MELAGRRGGQVAFGAVLGLASVAELVARLTAGSTVRVGLVARSATHTGVSVPTALLMCAFCLLATVSAVLLRPVPAAIPVAALAGIAWWAGGESRTVVAVRLLTEGVLAEHLARREPRPVDTAHCSGALGALTPRETEVLRLMTAEELS